MLALFSFHGFCLRRLTFPTSTSADTFLSSLKNHLSAFLSPALRAKILATTVAIPGVVRLENGATSFSFGNLSWSNIDLTSPIKSLVSGKIFFANDANLATLYEASRFRAKRKKVLYLTFSTGIGGGLAQGGKLLSRSDSFEPGHVSYSFQGASLEWEDIASAKILSSVYGAPLSKLPLTKDITSDLISRLSLGLLDLLETESPELIIIGGPLGLIINKIKHPLLRSLKSALLSQGPSSPQPSFKLIRARRPTESVIYGAYLFSKQNYRA